MILRFILLILLSFNLKATPKDFSNGTYTEKFDNGQSKYEITFKDGKKHGKEVFWYENGNKKMESHFLNGIENGLWQQWYENGQLKLRVNYISAKEDGFWE